MDRVGLEISDVGILAAGGNPAAMMAVDGSGFESPGYALPVKKKLLVGRAAFAQSRLHPRDTNNRFWGHLSTHAMAQNMGPAENYAEIAFQHIELVHQSLAQPGATWHVAAPGFLDEGRLGILLGILRELKIRVGSLVSLPIAACRPDHDTPRLIHLDVHLHTAEITELRLEDDLSIRSTHTVSNVGWGELLEEMGRSIADEFVRETRFDPLHQADSEQQLFNALLGIVWRSERTLRETIELSSKRSTHSLTVQPEMLVAANREQRTTVLEALDRLIDGDDQCVLCLSHRAAMVPGLVEALVKGIVRRVEVLPLGAAAKGILELPVDRDADGEQSGVTFVTRRPALGAVASAPPVAPPPVPPADSVSVDLPTHLLYGHRALPIDQRPICVGAAPGAGERSIRVDVTDGGVADRQVEVVRIGDEVRVRCLDEAVTWVDGERVEEGCSVRAGQVISLGGPGQELLFIRAEPDHGT